MGGKRNRRKKQSKKFIGIFAGILLVCGIAVSILATMIIRNLGKEKPVDLIVKYMKHIENQEYEEMYAMLDTENNLSVEKNKFIERNSKIYEGIEVKNLRLSKVSAEKNGGKSTTVSYFTSFETAAGKVEFENQADFIKRKEGYKLIWKDSLIFPGLTEKDKVQISISEAERGEILDRNGRMLAGKGLATSVGIVPGKLEENSLEQLSNLLEIDAETIESKLEASWVEEDSFVPVTTIQKIQETDLLTMHQDEETIQESERQKKMLEIPGVMLSDIEMRSYTLEEAAAHLIGYVQAVTAEDLEEHPDEGYHANSMIGRSGVEGLYEKELKGKDGCEIRIVDENGNIKESIASVSKEDGKDIQLTIDAELQKMLYQQFQEDTGCSVAMNPYTGEILALVSTPSYDSNEFIRGMSSEKWNLLNEDVKRPLYNRFRQVWCPGSTFKPVVAGIGLKTGLIDPNEDFGKEGLAWQKDSSWGDYQVTTLHEYEPVTMRNALIYSDNIYFAKAALKIGADNFEKSLDEVGFNQKLPFEIQMTESQYSNTDKIETEIQLADSGYGQGQVLVNPVHLASIYTAFLNEGNMIKPSLLYQENAQGDVWISEAFPSDAATEVLEGLKGVINDPNGTGWGAHREDILLAGKTGTAELKATKEDTTGTEIGWFSVFTTEKSTDKPILILSMAEDVKDLGGSGYVVKKDKAVLDWYLSE